MYVRDGERERWGERHKEMREKKERLFREESEEVGMERKRLRGIIKDKPNPINSL